MYRVVVLVNRTASVLTIAHLSHGSCLKLKVHPYNQTELPATFFQDFPRESTEILVLLGEAEAGTLRQMAFLNYVKLIFYTDPDSGLVLVSGIPAQPSDFLRRRCGFGFLRKDYKGRRSELLLENEFLRRRTGFMDREVMRLKFFPEVGFAIGREYYYISKKSTSVRKSRPCNRTIKHCACLLTFRKKLFCESDSEGTDADLQVPLLPQM